MLMLNSPILDLLILDSIQVLLIPILDQSRDPLGFLSKDSPERTPSDQSLPIIRRVRSTDHHPVGSVPTDNTSQNQSELVRTGLNH